MLLYHINTYNQVQQEENLTHIIVEDFLQNAFIQRPKKVSLDRLKIPPLKPNAAPCFWK